MGRREGARGRALGYTGGMSDVPFGEDFEFEFERKFFVRELPADVVAHADVEAIVQAYLFARDGYAVRVRLRFPGLRAEFPPFDERVDFQGAYERRVLADLLAQPGDGVRAAISVKSPIVTAERYEFEKEIDPDVGVQILRRCSRIVLKNRHSIWLGEDGWEFDVFGGQNAGLVVAECERLQPVVALDIPRFCLTEVSGDVRFTNDSLSKEPWLGWCDAFERELEASGPFFLDM